jgi:fructokinase
LLPDVSVLGGAPFNFTYRINSLGNEGIMVSAVGQDELAEKALNTISGLQISNRYIQVNPEYPTGTVNVFFDEFKNPDYEIIKKVAYDFISFNKDLERLIPQIDCICFGTLAQRKPISRETLHKLMKLFKGKYRFYDLNLRKDCYSVENITASLANADILKLNEREANELNEMLQLNKSELVEVCRELIDSWELQYCVITLEERGSLAVSARGEVVYTPGFKVELTDPLGSGDAFSAGFVDALLRGKSLQEASETGNRLGALVATQKGATQKITKREVDRIALKHRVSDQSYTSYVSQTYC